MRNSYVEHYSFEQRQKCRFMVKCFAQFIATGSDEQEAEREAMLKFRERMSGLWKLLHKYVEIRMFLWFLILYLNSWLTILVGYEDLTRSDEDVRNEVCRRINFAVTIRNNNITIKQFCTFEAARINNFNLYLQRFCYELCSLNPWILSHPPHPQSQSLNLNHIIEIIFFWTFNFFLLYSIKYQILEHYLIY